jgi:hypothetical protein
MIVRPILLVLLGLVAPAAVLFAADGVAGLEWTAPAAWTATGESPMRAASYTIPPGGGDSEGGECVVYYFGAGQGGGVEANVKRWIGQFTAPDGGPADKLAKRGTKTINGIEVETLELTGTYLFKPFPMAPKATPKPGYRMLAAIVAGADAPVFFKLTGPVKTVAAAEAAYEKMLASLRKR